MAKSSLTAKQGEALLATLQSRFEDHPHRHKGLAWAKVQARLGASPGKLASLQEMERTGGEPDVVGQDKKSGEVVFQDCSPQSPPGRRSLCYDREALESRKEAKPKGNAVDAAAAMGIELLTEGEYRALQELGEFDTTTSSWVKTPPHIRKLGGALFCDRRYDTVFVFHNGAESYYAARGLPRRTAGVSAPAAAPAVRAGSRFAACLYELPRRCPPPLRAPNGSHARGSRGNPTAPGA